MPPVGSHWKGTNWKAKKEKLEARAAAQEKQIEMWFASHDKSQTGKFDREEMRSLLIEVKRETLNDPSAIVGDRLLDKIVNQFDVSGDGQIERTEVLKAVKKFKAIIKHEAAFIKHEARLQALLDSFDADKSGSLTSDELLPLLKQVAAMEEVEGKSRYNATLGMKVAIGVGQADVDFVMERCDGDKSGSISLAELEPALATWKEAARHIPQEETQTSAACVLL